MITRGSFQLFVSILWIVLLSFTNALHTCESDDQCLNGGKCRDNSNDTGSFNQCDCVAGYGGNRCENYCPLECEHGGYCRYNGDLSTLNQHDIQPEDYMCKCLGHYKGTVCEIPYENCGDGGQCFYGGSCRDEEGQASSCNCPAGHEGPSCETEVSFPEESDNVLPFKAQGRGFNGVFMGIFVVAALVVTSFVYRRRERYVGYGKASKDAGSHVIPGRASSDGVQFVPTMSNDRRWANVV
jgi:hypothetical protein